MSSSAINTNQNILSPSGVAAAIRFMRGTGISLYVHGAPGISKSAVAKQEATAAGIAFIDFRLTSVAPEDIKGVPMIDDAGGIKGLIWTPPLVFPRDLNLLGIVNVDDGTQIISFYNPIGNNGIHYCKKPVIEVKCLDGDKTATIVDEQLNSFTVVVRDTNDNIVPGKLLWKVTGKSEAILGLEEFNSAEPAVMAASYQLILDRRVGDYVVPDGVMIVALGNRDNDKGVTYKIPKPVANRFDHIEMRHDFDDWQSWAFTADIHSDVVGYLTKWTAKLFDENFATNPTHSFATPRSWEFVSKIISKTPAPPANVLKALICGAIGDVVGTEFMSHRKYMEDMPNVQRIFDGTVTKFDPKHANFKTQIAYSTCVQMCYELKRETDAIAQQYGGEQNKLEIERSPERKKILEKMDKALGYAMDNFTAEVQTIFVRLALQVYRLRFGSDVMKRFHEYASQNRNSVLP